MATNAELSNLTNGLVSYWKLDGNSNDAIGTNHGVDANISYSVGGKIVSGASFNGVSSNVVISSSSTLTSITTAVTLSCWVYPRSTSSCMLAIKYFDGSGNGEYFLSVSSGYFRAASNGGNGSVFSLSPFSLNTWYHLTLVFIENSFLDFFVNGVSQGVDYTPGVINSSEFPLEFGNTVVPGILGFAFDGVLDEVGLWNRNLTAQEISIIYNNGNGLSFPFQNLIVPRRVLRYNNTSLSNGLLSYWKLDGDSSDSLGYGINNGSGTGITYSIGKVGYAANFDGSTSKIFVPDSAVFSYASSDFTISAWFKKAVNGTRMFIYGQSDNVGSNISCSVLVSLEASNYIRVFIASQTDPDSTYIELISSYAITDFNWHHFIVQRDGTTLRTFIDGVADNTSAIVWAINNSSNYFAIGAAGEYALEKWNGSIDEVAIWHRKLSVSEILSLYNNGNGNPTFSKNQLVAHWKLDQNALDSAGNFGVDTNISYVTGKINGGASFNGLTSYITVNNNIWSEELTLSCWVKVNDYGTSNPALAGKQIIFKAPDTGFVQDYTLSVGDNPGGKYVAFVFSNNNPDYHSVGYFLTGNFFEWMHIVATRAAGTSKIYVNGELVVTGTYSFTPVNNGNLLYLGNNPVAGIQRFDGLLDEVGIWNRAISQTEVTQLYNFTSGNQYPFTRQLSKNLPVLKSTLENGIAVYWKLDGNANDALNLNHGTGETVTYIDGISNKCAYFNGSSSRILIDDSSIFTFGANDFTVSCWIKTNTSGVLWISAHEDASGGNSNCGIFSYLDSGRYGFGFCYGSSAISAVGSQVLNDNNWHHVVSVRSGNTISSYVDGVYETGFTSSQSVNNSTAKFGIGSLGEYVFNKFLGSIDEYGIWHKALTVDEIVTLYNNRRGLAYPFHKTINSSNEQGVEEGLIGYWKLNGDSKDCVGLNNGIDTDVSYVAGKIGQGASFNGSTSDVVLGSIIPLSPIKGSVSIWCYHDNYNQIKRPYSDAGGYAYFEQGTFVSGRFYWLMYDGASGVSVSAPYELNTWIHWVATWENNNIIKLYKNGVLVDTNSISPASIILNLSYANHFGNYGGAGFFSGKIDEFGVWNRALSQNEVGKLYNSGIGLTYPFNRNVITTFNGLVSYHKFENNLLDSVGTAHGTDINLDYQSGKVNQGIYLDGSAYVENVGTVSTYSFFHNTGVFTISFWVKMDNYTSVPQYFMGNTPTTIENGFFLGTDVAGNLRIAVIYGVSSQYVILHTVNSFFTDNNWYHVAVVSNGSKVQFYRNGQPFGAIGSCYPINVGDSSRKLRFGDIQPGGYRMTGKLDEIGIWNRALTSDEISVLCNNGNGLQYDNYGKISTTKRLPLDNYPGALAGYSLRKLRDRYTGSCVRIRRSSDNAEQDFGFVNDYFDTASFANFVGNGIGYIKTWYDQGLNGLDVTQTTDIYQPYIQLNMLNGKAVVRFVQKTSNSFLSNSNALVQSEMSGILKKSSVFMAYRESGDVTFSTPIIFNHPPNSYFSYLHLWAGYLYQNFSERTDVGSSQTQSFANNVSNWSLVSSLYNTHIDGYINGSSVGTPVSRINSQITISQINIGGGSPSYCLDGQILECIIYASDKTNIRPEIERNINDYYKLY